MLSKNLLSRTLFAVGIMLAAGIMIYQAQIDKSEYQGKILDQNRAAVAGAKVAVAVKGVATASVTAVTDQNGEFTLSLAAGDYTFRVLANGITATRIISNGWKL